ncbi:SGNH/GDSL hydrolase family protein [Saccharophagus degradans]|uniref:GDSL-type esterase/lipase family protein n=1 Tax=Saccharophagus degradans TaxID=86304 RepID=A0AAW7X530_9GAMM|nr:GDSL-type esterase/lipase family protein [Saccharophagus degradans]MDO6422654.1 GDSL-type esterase/lipase family protein [Saccharophagus degradans]MDO6609651.1 GDSL-type esterase/lipase family protein [Saccharophagus degradans]
MLKPFFIGASLTLSLIAGCGSAPVKMADPATRNTTFPEYVTTPRIMIVGDSISAGPGCYKKHLKANLINAGITNYQFVGSYSDDCGGNVMHSAVSCSSTANFLDHEFSLPNCFADKKFAGITKLMQDNKPDMVMLQLGVNDVWGGSTSVSYVTDNYTKLVKKMRAQNPHVVIVVAQIHKIITDNCENMGSYRNAEMLVQAVPAWARANSTQQSPIYVADLWTNSDPKQAPDCVHPDEAGAERMGLNWFNALKPLLQ